MENIKYYQMESVSSSKGACNVILEGELFKVDSDGNICVKAYVRKNLAASYSKIDYYVTDIDLIMDGYLKLENSYVKKAVFRLYGKLPKNCLCLGFGGLVLSDKIIDYLIILRLNNQYSLLPTLIVKKNGVDIVEGFNNALIVTNRVHLLPNKDRKIELDFDPSELKDDRLFSFVGGSTIIVRSDIKEKLQQNFPSQFLFYPLPGDFTKPEEGEVPDETKEINLSPETKHVKDIIEMLIYCLDFMEMNIFIETDFPNLDRLNDYISTCKEIKANNIAASLEQIKKEVIEVIELKMKEKIDDLNYEKLFYAFLGIPDYLEKGFTDDELYRWADMLLKADNLDDIPSKLEDYIKSNTI